MTAPRSSEDLPVRGVRDVRVEAVRGAARSARPDVLAVEEPLEIRLVHGPEAARREATLGLTMRTPGADEELVAGLLLAEGIVRQRDDLAGLRAGTDRDGAPDPNVLVVELASRIGFDPAEHARALLTTSACGVCGRALLDTLASRTMPQPDPDRFHVSDASLRSLPDRLREAQRVFEATGGLHAAALFDADATVHAVREDVGRHNAVDKVLGAEFLAGRTPLGERGLLVSGRASYEILQKAHAAGLALVAAVGAPSSLAVELADRFGVTLVGFLKADGYNVYAGPQRVAAPTPAPPT